MMKLLQTAIPDVVIIEPVLYEDERGWFMESFNEQRFHAELQKLGLPVPRAFVQDNHSLSKKGVLRGLHYQSPPRAQGKLVRVVQGSAWDVVVDLRKDKATFGKWIKVQLSSACHRMLWIPEGFAHGFIALEENTEFLYKTTDYYAKDCERCIAWNDPDLSIQWPDLQGILTSEKDADGCAFAVAEVF